jgi:hypothetical protein
MDEAVFDHSRLGVEAHDPVGRRTAGIDPLLPFKVGPVRAENARKRA